MNRRDFLRPRQLAHTTGQVLGALGVFDEDSRSSEPVLTRNAALLRLGHRAMATSFEVLLPFGTPRAFDLGEAAFTLLDALEDQLTVYRDHSEVSRLNQRAPAEEVVVEPGLFELLQLAGRITAETDGAYDITAGTLIKAWGFFRGPRRVPEPAELEEALSRVGMRWVMLNPEKRGVRYLRPGLEINLGSIGKGYALDRLADLLAEEVKSPVFLLQGGHSSVYAKGSPDGNPRGWLVGIADPDDPTQRLGQLRLRDRALGTSAATFRHLEHNGRKLGHILDPRTGWPAEGVASVTVLAPTAAEADALATAFYVLGIEQARLYCAAHPEVGAVLLPRDRASPPVVLGLGPEEISLGG